MASYIRPHELQTYFSLPCRSLIHFNARSLQKNMDGITTFLSSTSHKFSVICISETWLSASHNHLYTFPSYSAEYCHRDNSNHGGAAVFVSSELRFHRRLDLTLKVANCESVWVEFHDSFFSQDKKNLIVGCIYRSPSSCGSAYCSALGNLLHKLSLEQKNVIIMGDININLLDPSNTLFNEYVNCLNGFGYENLVTLPTRCPANKQGTLIDHVLSNLLTNPDCGVVEASVTDHYPIFVRLNYTPCAIVTGLTRKKLNSTKFFELISATDWNPVIACDNPETAYDTFSKIISNALADSTEIMNCKKPFSAPRNPWLSSSLLDCLKKKDNLYRKTKKQPFNTALHDRYKKYSNRLGKLLKHAKTQYYENKIKCAGNDVKKQWEILNSFLGRSNQHSEITMIKSGDLLLDNPLDIANSFINFFCTDKQREDDPLTQPYPRMPHSFFLHPVTPEEIVTIISSLKNTGPGIDNFRPSLIKLIASLISETFCHIVNLIFTTGIFPSSLKKAKIIPVFKKGDKRLTSNYRPIAILSFFSKVVEKLIVTRLSSYFSKFHVLSTNQFGFREGYSTDLALIYLTDKIRQAIDAGNLTGALFIDLSKAFDSLVHNILFAKLESIGIAGPPLKLLRNYLKDREYIVSISNTYSHPKTSNIGVPQGSILGPLLFLIYINDLSQCLKSSDCILYADDTTIFCSDNHLDSLIYKLNHDADSIVTWCRQNKLQINATKSQFVIFSSKHRIYSGSPSLTFASNTLYPTDSVMFLGVTLDKHLKFDEHVSSLTKKTAYGIRILIKVRNFFHMNTLISLYYAFIHTYINYCISSWGNTYPVHLSPLQHTQNQAIRIMTHSTYTSEALPLLTSNGILSVGKLHKYSLAILIHKSISGKLPFPIIIKSQYPYSLSTRFASSNSFLLPKPRTNYGKFTTNFSATQLWNSLPCHVKNISNFHAFKINLRNYLHSA